MTSSECLRLLVIFIQVQYIIMLLMTSLELLTHVSIQGAMKMAAIRINFTYVLWSVTALTPKIRGTP